MTVNFKPTNLELTAIKRSLLTSLSVLMLAMCTDQGNPVVDPVPELALSADTVAFGAVQIGDSRLRFVEIGNTGTADLTGDLMLQQNGTVFTIQHSATYTILPGDTLRLGILYTPDAEQMDTASLSITSNDVNLPAAQITLTGSGSPLPEPGYELAPQSIDFGTVVVGQTGQRTLKIYSVGTADLNLDSLSISENTVTVSGFSVPAALAPGDSAALSLTWSPDSTGTLSANLTFYMGTPGNGTIPVNLTGEAQQPVSFANDIQPIFNAKCISCHGGNGGLFLTAGNSYSNLVNITSQGYSPALRVKPGDPAHSVLYGKVANFGAYGGLMPQGGPALPASQISAIQQWIEQ